jgi:hypothetical protein
LLTSFRTVNPGQDFDDHEDQLFEPPAKAVTAEDVARPNVQAATTEVALESLASGGSPGAHGVPLGAIGSRSLTSAGQNERRSHSLTVGGESDEKSKEVV